MSHGSWDIAKDGPRPPRIHIMNVHGGLFFDKRLAEADAEKRNLEALPFAPLSPRFLVVGIAHQNTFIAWTVMNASEVSLFAPV